VLAVHSTRRLTGYVVTLKLSLFSPETHA